jgi:hypothetical protein
MKVDVERIEKVISTGGRKAGGLALLCKQGEYINIGE